MRYCVIMGLELFPKRQMLDSSKLKEFADDNFIFDENGREFSKRIDNTVGEKKELLVATNFSFFHSVFKRIFLQTRKNKRFLGKGLTKYEVCSLIHGVFSQLGFFFRRKLRDVVATAS